jgi:radical SAM superfamily enzyme YgiQ (UPF0313 family)
MGQGEIAFQSLIKKLNKNDNFGDIGGLGYKKDGHIIINSHQKFIDIKEFPPISYDQIDINNYIHPRAYAERCISSFSSQGCPFNCAFCCVAKVYGRRWYNKKIDEIIKDLKHFKKMGNIDSVQFDDDNFFVNKEFTMQLCNKLIESKINLLWDTSAHAGLFLKLFTDEDLDIMYKSGYRQIYIGAESGDQEVLDTISKKIVVEDNYKFVELLNKHNITPQLSTIVCFPMNPNRDFYATLNMIRIAKLKDPTLRAKIFFYTPYPGTELYQKALAKGFKEPNSLEAWASHTLRKFHAPWLKKSYSWKLEVFVNFYLPLMNPKAYKISPRNIMPIVFIINKLFFPTTYLRFKLNFFKYPIEAILFLKLLRIFNKIANKKYRFGIESYLGVHF